MNGHNHCFLSSWLLSVAVTSCGITSRAHPRPPGPKPVDAAEFARHGVKIDLVYVNPIEYHWEIRRSNHRAVKVHRMIQFVGSVRINSAGAALRYVTLADEDGLGADIGPIEEQPIQHVRHLAAVEEAFGGDSIHATEGSIATVSDAAWRELHLFEPRVRRDGHAWLVTRPVLINHRGVAPHPWIVTEYVGPNGRYSVIKKRAISFDKNKFDWTMRVITIALPGA